MSIYEKAAERLSPHEAPKLFANEVQAVAAAVWDAIYVCPQCDGTGEVTYPDGDETTHYPVSGICPAQCVQLVNPHSGEERWCRPDMAMALCRRYVVLMESPDDCKGWDDTGAHFDCGWVPVAYEGNNE